MKVFISSLITGMEPARAAAKVAIETLGHQATMAEDFGAMPQTPQVACLDGVRKAGAVVLMLGQRYGAVQPSGLSATHEEFREAHDRCPVLAFVEEGATPEPKQAEFLREVQAWDSGLFRASFASTADLDRKVVQALHRLELASAAAPFDARELLGRTLAAFPDERGSQGTVLAVSVAGGPGQAILRPSRIEDPALAETLEKEALYGSGRLFLRGGGTEAKLDEGALVIEQAGARWRVGRSIRLDAQGGVLVRSTIETESGGLPVILVETLQERLAVSIRYAVWILDQVDPTQKLSHLAVAARLTGGFGMRTRSEHLASPHSMSMGSYGNDHKPVHLSPGPLPRPALAQGSEAVVDDLMTLLRRQRR